VEIRFGTQVYLLPIPRPTWLLQIESHMCILCRIRISLCIQNIEQCSIAHQPPHAVLPILIFFFFFLKVRGVSKDPEAASLYYSVGIKYNRTRRKENYTKVLQISKEDPETKAEKAIGSFIFSTDDEPWQPAAMTPPGTHHLVGRRRGTPAQGSREGLHSGG
jgi:hypothetical protein